MENAPVKQSAVMRISIVDIRPSWLNVQLASVIVFSHMTSDSIMTQLCPLIGKWHCFKTTHSLSESRCVRTKSD